MDAWAVSLVRRGYGSHKSRYARPSPPRTPVVQRLTIAFCTPDVRVGQVTAHTVQIFQSPQRCRAGLQPAVRRVWSRNRRRPSMGISVRSSSGEGVSMGHGRGPVQRRRALVSECRARSAGLEPPW
jgi:hypothetical protein